ncbi:hypothetical protein D1BOALGB6SA_5030 [Olavius sp. associated proteobacterium Delta 1]|nr:hypothetical protein D1BOALGB6SA_5030 [Olavius sp. associated proteobacterium Delta 1]
MNSKYGLRKSESLEFGIGNAEVGILKNEIMRIKIL